MTRSLMALAVSVVPEALPVVVTIALSKGAIKLAKDKVVVKRLSAVEDLGSVEILCTDKTGTLTTGQHVVRDVAGVGMEPDELLRIAGAVESQSEHPLAKAIVTPKLLRKRPGMPAMKATGRKTATSESVVASTARPISLVAATAAS